jgi:drug/metabolite transporter (DMT)-like permease
MSRWIAIALLLLPSLVMGAEPLSEPADPALYDFGAVMQELADTKQGDGDVILQHRIENEFWYVVVLAGMLMLTLVVVLWFLKQSPEATPKDMVNVTGLTLIVFGTIILVLIVDTTEQLTAAIGILGAIAGYLFRSVQERGEVRASRQRESDS